MRGPRPCNHNVHDDCEVAEPDRNTDAGDVRNPNQNQLGRNGVAVKLRENRPVVMPVDGEKEAAPPLGPQTLLGGDGRYTRVVDGVVVRRRSS